MDKMHASNRMGMENQTFMKVAAICTWLGDFITAWMVTDMMLQVNNHYFDHAPPRMYEVELLIARNTDTLSTGLFPPASNVKANKLNLCSCLVRYERLAEAYRLF